MVAHRRGVANLLVTPSELKMRQTNRARLVGGFSLTKCPAVEGNRA
jgi:hypothetical protein